MMKVPTALLFLCFSTCIATAQPNGYCGSSAGPSTCVSDMDTAEGAPRPATGTSLLQTKYVASKEHMDFSDNSDDLDSQILGTKKVGESEQPKQHYTVGATGDFPSLAACIEHVKSNPPRHCRLLP